MATIAKNTKKFKEVLNKKGWMVSCLENYFKSEPISENAKFDDFDIRHGKLIEEETFFKFRIHSNLWYTLAK